MPSCCLIIRSLYNYPKHAAQFFFPVTTGDTLQLEAATLELKIIPSRLKSCVLTKQV